MKWLQSGVAKSGNLWLFNILKNVADEAHLERRNFIQKQPIHAIAKDWKLSFPGQADIDTLSINADRCLWRISGVVNMPIEDIDDYLSQASHVWTQSYFSKMSEVVFPKFDKVVYVVRDPRDVAVSMSRFSFTPYRLKYFPKAEESADRMLDRIIEETMHAWVRHVGEHLLNAERYKIHILFYEKLLADFDGELEKLLAYLGVKLDAGARAAVKQKSGFESMRADAPGHVRKGESSQWTEVFTDSQAKRASAIAGPLLAYLGYPAGKKEAGSRDRLPALPRPLDQDRLNSILARRRRVEMRERILRSAGKLLGRA